MKKHKNTLFAAAGLIVVLPCTESVAATLEEVVVTAQKREQSVQDIPITVNALTGETLSDFGVDNLFKLADLVPGMVFSRAPDDGLALTLRGLGTPARTQSFDQSVALFLNGMFIASGRMYSSAFFDVDRIEVIKGTQSTLLGKNTSLGALSVVTRKPGDEFGGNLQVSREFENGGWTLDGAMDLPASDTLSFRLAAHYVDQQGWVKNTLTGEDVPADEDWAVRASGAYNPTDRLFVNVSFQTSRNERTGNGFQFIDNGNYFSSDVLGIYGESKLDDKKAAICPECPGGESFHDTEADLAGLTIDYDIGEHTLTSVTSYATYNLQFFDDFDFGNAFDETTYVILDPGTVSPYSTYFQRDEDFDSWSQELRFTSPAGNKIEYMAGLFYFQSDWNSSEQQFFRTPNFPPAGPTGQIFNGPFTNNFSQDVETWSAFGQISYEMGERWRSTLGLRYTDEQKDARFQRVRGDPVTIWNSVINPPFDSPLEFGDEFLNGNVSIQFAATSDVMAYASYGVGSKTGGYAESAEVTSADPSLSVDDGGARVETEKAKTYEMGAKMTLLDGVANLNISVFYTEVDDFQETSFLVTDAGAQFLTRNIDAETEGLEFDGQWQMNETWRLTGGVTYADATNSNDNTTLAQAPKWTSSIGLNFETMIRSNMVLSGRGFVRYRDDMVSQINETFPSDSLTTVDLNFSVSDAAGTWKISLIGTNITDEVATDFSGPPAAPIGALFGAPPGDQGVTAEAPSALRTIALKVEYYF
ncbi:TonB-dependent receptor [Haliea sp. E1-2-M8]|uniref:TonB-dependent receptor n=1 Tax=Haliea sp. E1-2-M8 TaxID=3064706 RepID=UPI00271CE5A3|nr:TonB-dependent receptor [Haliea sp. E1-2-M8]MDO8863930.1 TonB-dependent receptor [Haliea sp. E1-2-M8]